jgi:lysozyme family protein
MSEQEAFEKAVAKTLDREGGYIFDPDDPGGETKFGISKRSYPTLNIKALTKEQAIAIYRRDYWDRGGYGMLAHERLAAKLFDLAVNMGPRQAHRLLQRAINATTPWAVTVDGLLGPKTMEAVNEHPHGDYLLAALKLAAINFYTDLGKRKYLAGWIRRTLA